MKKSNIRLICLILLLLIVGSTLMLSSCQNGNGNAHSTTVYVDGYPLITDVEIYKDKIGSSFVFNYESLSDIGEFSSYKEYLILKDKNGLEIKIHQACPYYSYLDNEEVMENFQTYVEVFFDECILFLRDKVWGKDFSLDKVVKYEDIPDNMTDLDSTRFISVNDIYYRYSISEDNNAKLNSIAVIIDGALICFECSAFEDYAPVSEDNLLTCLLKGNPDNVDLSKYLSKEITINEVNIKKGMTYKEVVDILGNEGKSVGFGLIIYVWDISDDESLYIWFNKEITESLEDMTVDSFVVKDKSEISE